MMEVRRLWDDTAKALKETMLITNSIPSDVILQNEGEQTDKGVHFYLIACWSYW